MFCPRCGRQYQPGIQTCAGCGVALAEQPPEQQPKFTELETVFSTNDQGVLALIKSLLEAEGLPYLAQGDAFNALAYNIANSVHIRVRPEDAERAREILAPLTEETETENDQA